MKTETTTKQPNERELGSVLAEALDDDRFYVMPAGLALRTGTHGWRWPGAQVSWSTEEAAKRHFAIFDLSAEQLKAGPKYLDDRLTIQEVARLLARAEREAYLRLNDIPACEARAYVGGAWNEYLAPNWGTDDNRPWPDDCYMTVAVVPGGNEGLALRVETCDNSHELLLTGKSLGCTWQECYESAGRISAMLNH